MTGPDRRPTGFFLHPASSLHDTGWGHPEHQGRLRALASSVGKDLLTLHGRVVQEEGGEAALDDLRRVHAEALVTRVRDLCAQADVQQKILGLDPDTRVSPASWDAAVGSSGSVIEACRRVADGALGRAFVAARPPGHHATPHHAMGFCLFNHVAVAARWLQAHDRAERILILDWDVHHGNGTQDVFYEDPSVYFLSLHQSPHYPGTGAADERGQGSGRGSTLNVPLPGGVPVAAYREAFDRALDRVLTDFRPDFVLVSSGFDCLRGDPLGDFPLEPTDLHDMTRAVVERADALCGGRVVAVLEGGYVPERVGAGAVAVIRALADLPPREDGGPPELRPV